MKYLLQTILFCHFMTPLQAQHNTNSKEQERNRQLTDRHAGQTSASLSVVQQTDTLQSSRKPRTKALPLQFSQRYNSSAPYGWNDGPMIAAKGYQLYAAAGLRINYRKWELQLQPEAVLAANRQAEDFPLTETDQVRLARLPYLNHTDLPFRFGNKTYRKLYPGQSHFHYHFKNMALGISTENLSWGPGMRNALIMSNNAPGFWHATWHTTRPLQTRIGALEFQLIAGRLEGSGFSADPQHYQIGGQNHAQVKPDDWRYLNGLSLNYQPKWIPGLYLGLNRVFQIYSNDLQGRITDYLPVITPFQKKNLKNEDQKKRDQIASIFLRWVLPRSQAELYLEYGKNDHSKSFLDFLISPEHARAYIAGFRKLWPGRSPAAKLRLNLEITVLQQSADRIVRPAGAWYLHGTILHGYTHQGQVIGAGIGPGANLQTIDLAWMKPDHILGFQLERYAHNLDFFYDAYADPNTTYDEYNRKWVDLIFTLYQQKNTRRFTFNNRLSAILMRNYQYQTDHTQFNLQLQTSLTYKF